MQVPKTLEKQWLPEFRKALARRITLPVVTLLARTPVTPDAVTWFGLFLTTGAALLIASGRLIAGGVIVLLAGFCDILDGALARLTTRASRFGAVLDSTLDRLAEAIVLVGILFYYATTGTPYLAWLVMLVAATLVGSFLVSYIRSRAETIGLNCETGLFTRAERVVVLALGLLLNWIGYALIIALAFIALLSFFTAGQRLLYVWRKTRGMR